MWARRLRNESWDVIRESPGLKPLRLQQFLRTSEALDSHLDNSVFP